jgi:hypothetical protein
LGESRGMSSHSANGLALTPNRSGFQGGEGTANRRANAQGILNPYERIVWESRTLNDTSALLSPKVFAACDGFFQNGTILWLRLCRAV